MSYDEFHATYAVTSGPVRLGQWECTDAHRPTTRLGPQARNYRATIAVGDRISTSTAAASGPVAALTAMLYERGVALEVLKFRQVTVDDGFATFVRGTNGYADEWAVGTSDDVTQSALRAMIACVNRLS
jgi:LeuA allosteric (dimerisation) domain